MLYMVECSWIVAPTQKKQNKTKKIKTPFVFVQSMFLDWTFYLTAPSIFTRAGVVVFGVAFISILLQKDSMGQT